MKFDYIIGNPPYQTEQNGRMLPVYHTFMDSAFLVADVCELITPGRFLFNAGQTGSEWNRKILSDPHFKVLMYESDSKKIFSSVDIKGGVAISLHDNQQEFEPIKIFIADNCLKDILDKVVSSPDFSSIKVFTSTRYALNVIFEDHPEYVKYVKHEGRDSQIDTNAFSKMPIFLKTPIGKESDYVRIYGRHNNQREFRWVLKKYMADPGNLFNYKVFVSKANGTGAFEALSSPVVGAPSEGSTQSFLTIGAEETREAAENILKYLKTKFARAMLGVLKITQDNSPSKWKYVPQQNFISYSDIDWSKSIADIDQQLYKKYGLTTDEITFIETHVKEME